MASPTPTELLEAAQSLLERVLKTECAERESALDLLTADALVTYALELANENSASGGFSSRAMAMLGNTITTGKHQHDRPDAGRE